MNLCALVENFGETLSDLGIFDIPIIQCFAYSIYIFWADLLGCDN